MDFEVVPFRHEDAGAVVELMSRTPGVAFCPWENVNFLRRQQSVCRSVALVARHRELVIGALLGGVFARRAMICHLAIAEEWRSHGAGTRLVKHAYRSFRALNSTKVHVMVTKENFCALSYWQRLGFAIDRRCLTLECDLSHPRGDSSAVRAAAPNDLDCILAYVRKCGRSFHEWNDKNCLSEELRAAESVVSIAGTAKRIEGIAVGGSFGFRAQISHLHASGPDACRDLIESVKERFAELGVLRIHARVPKWDPNLHIWRDAGLREQEGEYTLSRAIPSPAPSQVRTANSGNR